MILLKSCPRCRGDLLLEEDHYGRYYSCLQCGLEVFPERLTLLPADVIETPAPFPVVKDAA